VVLGGWCGWVVLDSGDRWRIAMFWTDGWDGFTEGLKELNIIYLGIVVLFFLFERYRISSCMESRCRVAGFDVFDVWE